MNQTTLNGLAILSVEREAANKVDFNAVIKEFTGTKVRMQSALISLFKIKKKNY